MISYTYLIGTLAKAPRIAATRHNTPVADFSMCVADSWRTRDGEKREELIWWRIVAWGRLAHFAMSLKAGDVVYACGSARLDTYQGGGNQPRASLELRASFIKNLSNPSNGSSASEVEVDGNL